MIDYEKILSETVKDIKPSGIRRFFDIANKMEGVISLGVGEPDFRTPWKVRYKADLKAGDTAVYQAVIFGDQYYGIAWSLPVELRDNGVEDFGRKRSLAWYAIWGTGLLHNEYGVVIETA